MSNPKIDTDKFVENIKKAKAEDLVFIAKVISEKKELQRTQVIISSALATMAGAAIFAAYLFPNLSLVHISIGSAIFGLITVSTSFWQHRKEEIKLYSRILKENDNPTDEDLRLAEEFRQEIISASDAEKE